VSWLRTSQKCRTPSAAKYVIENPSTVRLTRDSTMTEIEFLHALVDVTGCRLLCDVSNVYLSGHNMGYDPYDFIDTFPAAAVAELHLGGFTPEGRRGGRLAPRSSWTHMRRRSPNRPGTCTPPRDSAVLARSPTLIEWDNDLPTLDVLAGEAAKADRLSRTRPRGRHAGTC